MKLKLEEIRVESYATLDVDVARGTVRGEEMAASLVTCRLSCPPKYTCPECAPPALPDVRRED
ncbi:MAG: hypothetical protein JO306_00720 [Gemmatimonadetes bacterium]|nr:hypothetical protein [Gemmatimonadota bacterium]